MKKDFATLKDKEKQMLLSIIKAKSISRTTLQKESKLKIANFYNTVDTLLSSGMIVKEEEESHNGKGRPSETLSFNSDYCKTFYIQLAANEFVLGVANLDGKLSEERHYHYSDDTERAFFFNTCAHFFEEMKAHYDILYVTLVSAVYKSQNENLSNKTFFGEIDVEGRLSSITGLPVCSDSIARGAAIGIYKERYFQKHVSLAFFNIGIGIGLGIVHSGIPEPFWHNNRIAIGHWALDPNGKLCSCGERGCLATTLGANNIVENLKEELANGATSSLTGEFSFGDVVKAANCGDALSKSAMDKAVDSFVTALKNLYYIIHFDVAAVGGVMCQDNDYFCQKLNEKIESLSFSLDIEHNFLEKTSIGISYKLLLEELSVE